MISKRIKAMTAVLVGTSVLTSCALQPADKSTREEKTAATAVTSPINTASVSNSSNASSDLKVITKSTDMKAANISNSSSNAATDTAQDFLDLPLPGEGTVSKAALDKYVDNLMSLKSDRADFTWTRETGEKTIEGDIVIETNYEEGAPSIMKVVSEEKDAPAEPSEWYRDREKLMVKENGKFKEIQLRNMQDSGTYEFSALVTKALSLQEATEDDKDYTVSINTDDEKFIREVMTYAGYTRNGADDWKSDLVMELLIDKETGYLKSVTYSVTHKDTGDKDTGEIRFSEQNEVPELKMPKAGDEAGTTATKPETAAETEAEYSEEAAPDPAEESGEAYNGDESDGDESNGDENNNNDESENSDIQE